MHSECIFLLIVAVLDDYRIEGTYTAQPLCYSS